MAEITAAPHQDDVPSSSTASCPASISNVHYHIFISYCGQDAGIFATTLRNRLLSRGLHVFLDELEFKSEEEVTSRRKAAISLASVQIAILSPSYAQWKWCLDALIHITNLEGTTFPVFYKVKPSEVRWTGKDNDGPYALWMHDHEEKERHDLETIQNWRDVLSQVSNISGFDLEAFNWDEEELLKRIVESVFKVCPHPHYNVFISNRGPDTKKIFAGPLYHRLISSARELCSRELRVFLDDRELVQGLPITTQIEVAIQVAFVHIVIFSPKFAESSWCLDELSLMIKSGAPILLVFYELKPSDMNGVYYKSLLFHEKKQRYNSETIQRWRDALANVPKSKYFVLDGNNEELMDKIVQSVLKDIPKLSEVMQSSEEVQSVVKCVLNENVSKRSGVGQSFQSPVEEYYSGLAKKLDFQKALASQEQKRKKSWSPQQRKYVDAALENDGWGRVR